MRLFKSRTTQNVAAGTLAGGGSVVGVLAFVRTYWPGVIPWEAEADTALAVVISTVLVPLVSRLIAMWRTPEKQGGAI